MRHSMPRFLVFALALVLLFSASLEAQTVAIPSSAAVGPPSTAPGTGLQVQWFSSFFGNLATQALTQFAGQTPTATFRATLIKYGTNDSSTTRLSTFLGADAGTLTPSSAGSTIMASSFFHFTGLISIPTTSLNFALSSDDGAVLKIGGVTVVNNDGPHGPSFGSGTVNAVFGAPGLYPIDLIYFENSGGEADIELFSNLPGASATPQGFFLNASGAPGVTGVTSANSYYSVSPSSSCGNVSSNTICTSSTGGTIFTQNNQVNFNFNINSSNGAFSAAFNQGGFTIFRFCRAGRLIVISRSASGVTPITCNR